MEKYAGKRDELVITARGDPSSAETLQNVKDNIETDYQTQPFVPNASMK